MRNDARRFDVARTNSREVVTTPCLPGFQIKLAAHSTLEADAISFAFMRERPRHLAMPTRPDFGNQKQQRVSALFTTMHSRKRGRWTVGAHNSPPPENAFGDGGKLQSVVRLNVKIARVSNSVNRLDLVFFATPQTRRLHLSGRQISVLW